ncbi:MAG: sigma-70 family RNA polymerase sigma factor [Paracoccaceae bacterium]|nr:sigma-70 family RNA polymerase sigma factor [Paracoccaceae bacterium]
MRNKERALEAYLVAASRGGDTRAMDGLVRLRGPRLRAHAARLLGDGEVAQDIVQEAWADILRGLHGLRDERAFLPWALQIVSRRVAREIAGRQRQRRLAEEYGAEAEDRLEDLAGNTFDAGKVRQAVNGLPADHKATIALFYLEDMTVAEVAVALDVPPGTVKTRLMHARAKLRRALEGDGK